MNKQIMSNTDSIRLIEKNDNHPPTDDNEYIETARLHTITK